MTTRRDMLRIGAAAAAGAALGAFGARAAPPKPSAAREDVKILRRAFLAMHPGLYRYASPSEVAARFDALEDQVAASASRAEAFLVLSRFLATIRCGHTYANPYNQSDEVVAELFAGRTRLPFEFRWLDGRMIATRDLTAEGAVAPGDEIETIDGLPARDLLAALLPYARADGGNDAKRRALLEVRGVDRYETFDIYQGLARPPRDGAFRLALRSIDGRRREVRAPAIDQAAREAARRDAKGEGIPWTLEERADGIAILVTSNWAVYNSDWDWKGFLDASFERIRDARGLIVDLRGNEGGLDCGDEILARLVDAPIAKADYARRTRYRRAPKDLEPYLDTWDKSFLDWGAEATERGDGSYDLAPAGGAEPIAPKGPRFRGKVAVLIDSSNSSATFQFASLARANRLGTLVGEPTGGNRRGINGGAFFFLRLPHTGLEADLPLIGTFPREAQPDEGLRPDVAAAPTAEDIAAGRDPAMEAALAAIA